MGTFYLIRFRNSPGSTFISKDLKTGTGWTSTTSWLEEGTVGSRAAYRSPLLGDKLEMIGDLL